ncbi:uncharacterized protein LOC143149453 [Ptiloglossa arizonensis]|uniref:uncharacterized protein LOC143149453 n=1 Tax=Ptiloglossa arizonensis TaxID=3350558 RepID=UPI003F9F90D1
MARNCCRYRRRNEATISVKLLPDHSQAAAESVLREQESLLSTLQSRLHAKEKHDTASAPRVRHGAEIPMPLLRETLQVHPEHLRPHQEVPSWPGVVLQTTLLNSLEYLFGRNLRRRLTSQTGRIDRPRSMCAGRRRTVCTWRLDERNVRQYSEGTREMHRSSSPSVHSTTETRWIAGACGSLRATPSLSRWSCATRMRGNIAERAAKRIRSLRGEPRDRVDPSVTVCIGMFTRIHVAHPRREAETAPLELLTPAMERVPVTESTYSLVFCNSETE